MLHLSFTDSDASFESSYEIQSSGGLAILQTNSVNLTAWIGRDVRINVLVSHAVIHVSIFSRQWMIIQWEDESETEWAWEWVKEY